MLVFQTVHLDHIQLPFLPDPSSYPYAFLQKKKKREKYNKYHLCFPNTHWNHDKIANGQLLKGNRVLLHPPARSCELLRASLACLHYNF